MPTTTEYVRCLRCGRKFEYCEGNSVTYHCGRCDIDFDNEPNEGGDYSMHNPAVRLEREDRWRQRKLDRLGRRR